MVKRNFEGARIVEIKAAIISDKEQVSQDDDIPIFDTDEELI